MNNSKVNQAKNILLLESLEATFKFYTFDDRHVTECHIVNAEKRVLAIGFALKNPLEAHNFDTAFEVSSGRAMKCLRTGKPIHVRHSNKLYTSASYAVCVPEEAAFDWLMGRRQENSIVWCNECGKFCSSSQINHTYDVTDIDEVEPLSKCPRCDSTDLEFIR